MSVGDEDNAVLRLFGEPANMTQNTLNFIITSEEIDEIQKQIRIIQEIFPLTATGIIDILNKVRNRQA